MEAIAVTLAFGFFGALALRTSGSLPVTVALTATLAISRPFDGALELPTSATAFAASAATALALCAWTDKRAHWGAVFGTVVAAASIVPAWTAIGGFLTFALVSRSRATESDDRRTLLGHDRPVAADSGGLAAVSSARPCVGLTREWTDLDAVGAHGRVALVADSPLASGPVVVYFSGMDGYTPGPDNWPSRAMPGFDLRMFDRRTAATAAVMDAEATSVHLSGHPVFAAPHVARLTLLRTPGAPTALPIILGPPGAARIRARPGRHTRPVFKAPRTLVLTTPSVLLFGPTVTALRLSLLAWNLAFGFMLVTTLVRESRLSPWLALAPATFFLLAPASVASQLMWAQGGIVEPYVYVGALWLLRKRPMWFGALLAVGFRNREFVAYAVPALLIVEACSAELTANRARDWLISGVVFAAVWQLVEALKPSADLMGPGTRGQPPPGFLGSQFQNLVDRFDFGFAAAPGRVASIGPAILEWFSGAGQVDSTLPVSAHPWMTAAAALFLVFAIVRLVMLIARSGAAAVNRAGFPLYLAIVGALAILFFVVGKPVLPGYSRYVLLGIVFPIGLSGGLLTLEPLPVARGTVAALLLGWSVLSAADHISVATTYSRRPEPNAMRAVADQLVAEGVHVASAGYWRAYVITFFSGERLHVASQELPRIQMYQDEFLERRNHAVLISDYPCAVGRMIEDLYVCKP